MHHRVFLTAFALSTAAVLGGTAPTAMAADSPAKEARIGLIADTTAKCLGMSDKAPLKGIPDLTTFTAKDLARLRVPEYAKCAEAVKNDSDNPVNALIEKLKSSDVLNGLAVSSDDLSPQFGLVEERRSTRSAATFQPSSASRPSSASPTSHFRTSPSCPRRTPSSVPTTSPPAKTTRSPGSSVRFRNSAATTSRTTETARPILNAPHQRLRAGSHAAG